MQFIEWSNPESDYYESVYHYLTERNEQVRAFGLQWLNDQLQSLSKHDHRLDTVLAILDRYGVIGGSQPPACYQVIACLPPSLRDDQRLQEKRRRDQQKLYALVEYANLDGDRKVFIHRYFGLV
jgi:ATP-dependent DNA helicase RecQ